MQQSRLGQDKDRSQKFHSGLPHWQLWLRHFIISHCLQRCVSRELNGSGPVGTPTGTPIYKTGICKGWLNLLCNNASPYILYFFSILDKIILIHKNSILHNVVFWCIYIPISSQPIQNSQRVHTYSKVSLFVIPSPPLSLCLPFFRLILTCFLSPQN